MSWTENSTTQIEPERSTPEAEPGGREQLGLENVVTTTAPARWLPLSKPKEMGSALLLCGLLWCGPVDGGTAASAPSFARPAQLRYIEGWTSTASTVLTQESAMPIGDGSANINASAQQVHWLHEQSGLTWDQLGRAFGVSRRAVHMWANGGRMNATNAELLAQLVTIVNALPYTDPQARRAALLESDSEGRNLLDAFRQRQVAHEQAINGPGFAPDRLLGARHDRRATEQ